MRGKSVEGSGGSKGGRAATVLPLALLLLTAVLMPLLLTAGEDLEPEAELAGRYSVSLGTSCIGNTFDLRQSGQFLTVSRADGEEIARLRTEDGRLSGEATCADGSVETVAGQAASGLISGSVGDLTLRATRTREFDETTGLDPTNPANVDGDYTLSPESVCLGRTFTLDGGETPVLTTETGAVSTLKYGRGELRGPMRCLDGGAAVLRGVSSGDRLEIETNREVTPAGMETTEQAVAETEDPLGERAAAFFLAVVIVVAATALAGLLAGRLGQPRVMGEIVAGILLGPTLLGAVAPDLQAEIFSADVLSVLGVVANLGLVIYMFLIGLELEGGSLRGRGRQVVAVGLASFLVPMLLGAAAALVIFERLAPDTTFVPFALFLGISMSITAFPVLARILEERGMLGKTLGSAALTAAAIDDLLGWLLLTLATALALAGPAEDVLPTLGWVLVFGAVMLWIVRPLLRRAAGRYERRASAGWIALVLAGVLVAAYATETIGVALIIGALLMGAVMPRRTALTDDLRRGSETFVTLLLLPLFFAYTGLRTDVGALGAGELWLIAGGLLCVAIAGKLLTAMLAARFVGFDWRESAILGTLMNTRGLTELIVLNLALEAGVISEALFTALVLMALVTTFMAGPLLRLLDPQRRYGSPTPPPGPSRQPAESRP